MDKESVDVVCIYCPETDARYYVRPIEHGSSVTLRIKPSRNGQDDAARTPTSYRRLVASSGTAT